MRTRSETESNSVDRRVGRRCNAERNGGSSPLWRDACLYARAGRSGPVDCDSYAAQFFSPGCTHGFLNFSAPFVDPEAKQFYLKGIFYFNKRTPETLNQAVDYFTQAVVRDPQYAEAYVGLADCYICFASIL